VVSPSCYHGIYNDIYFDFYAAGKFMSLSAIGSQPQRGIDSGIFKSENFSLTLCMVRLLVKAVAGGASRGSGKNKQLLLRACSPNK
jgi:hypothetical protein